MATSSLRDKYCIVGVGETEYSRHSGRTTRAMAVEAVRKAILDAGLRASNVDGMMSYQNGDSTPANWVAPDLGIRLNFYMDVIKAADHVIDLGPEAGDEGGEIVAEGPPEVVAQTAGSYTGKFLAEVLPKLNGKARVSYPAL